MFSLYEFVRSGFCFEAILLRALQRHVRRLSSACGWTGSGSLKGWAWAAVKQRDEGRQCCQRGPCVLLLWTSTVGPPSGWVPQPGPWGWTKMGLTTHLFETRISVLLLIFTKWLSWARVNVYTLISSVKTCETTEAVTSFDLVCHYNQCWILSSPRIYRGFEKEHSLGFIQLQQPVLTKSEVVRKLVRRKCPL